MAGTENYLLDMTPATTSWFDPALITGTSFTDPATGITITTISADNTGAMVRVDMNSQPQPTPTPNPTPTPSPIPTPTPQPCVRANPTISVSPGRSAWTAPGGSFTYQVSVRNNNSGGCGSDVFNLAASVPPGLSASMPSGQLSLPNGATGSANLSVTSSISSAQGTYNLGVAAASSFNPGVTTSTSAQHVVLSQLGVTAVAGAAKYNRSQTATVTSVVTAMGSPVSGATVTFSMTKPDGRSLSQTAITGADGKAVYTYKFARKRDLIGTYTVSSVASMNGFTGQGATSFLVNK